MSEDFSGMTEDDWFNSDYMDEEDYRSVHGASNVGDFSWGGQDMWNTSPSQSNDMHGLLGGSFNEFTDTTNNTVTGGAINPITGLPVESGRGLIDMVRQNAVKNNLTQQKQPSDIPQIDVTKPLAFEVDVRPKDLGMFPGLNRRPSFADKMANMNKGLISGIGDFAKDAVTNTVGGPAINWYNNMTKASEGVVGYDKNAAIQSQMQQNFVPDFAVQTKGIVDMVSSPLQTGQAAIDLVSGAFQHLTGFDYNPDDKAMATAVGDAVIADYGSIEGFSKTLSERPVEALTMLTGAGFITKALSHQAKEALTDPVAINNFMNKTPGLMAEPTMPIIAHHGGNLPNDKFDISKTGSGQGMSTYGWGINLTGSPRTADAYKTMATMRGGEGSVYDVDVDDLTFINREKTLSEQTQTIQDIAKAIDPNVDLNTITGQTLYRELTDTLGSKQAASEFLNSKGVKGISYHDGHIGDGRNYVVFDDSILTVLKKDGDFVKSALDVGGKITTMSGIAAVHNVGLDALKSKLATHRVSQKDYTSWTMREQKSFIDNAPDTIKGKGKDSQLWGREGQMLTERQIRGGETKELAKSLKISDSHLKNLANKRLGITIEQFKTLTFEDQKLAVQIGEGYDRPMVVQHNVSAESLLKQKDGLPMPSMAIANANNPLTKFGDISLIGDKNLVDNYKTTIHTSDMYSGRQPGSRLAYTNLDEIAKQVDEKTLNYYGFHTVDDLTPGRLEGRMEATKEYIETINPKTNRYYNPDDYKSFSEMRSAAISNRQYIDEPFVGKENYLGETHQTIMNAKGQEVPWNVKDVMQAMRKKKSHLAGTEGLTGAGQARALASDEFKNISEVKKNRDRLTDQKGRETEFKYAWKSRHETAMEDVSKIAENLGETYEFGHLERYGDIIEDSIKGADLSWTGWPADKIAEVKAITNELKEVAKTLKTEYFEAKTKAVVDISEFKGAIIPEGATEAEALLIEKGVTNILKYGTEKERVGLFKQFPELFFNTAPIGIGAGYMGYGEPEGTGLLQ